MKSLLLGLALGALIAAPALAETCTKAGEEISGMNKVCSYRCSFGEASETVGAARMCPMSIQASAMNSSRPRPASGGSCFKTGERTTGMTKQCLYDCTGSAKAVTVGSAQLCPLTTSR